LRAAAHGGGPALALRATERGLGGQIALDLAVWIGQTVRMTRMASESATPLSELADRVAGALTSPSEGAPHYAVALRSVAEAFGAVSATLHRADANAQQLHMVAQLGLPEPLIALTRQIPFGKGIAGLCAAQREPITLCNLQTDTSGAARPNAKQTGVAGAISVPVFGPDGALVGTLGVGKLEEHTYSPDEIAILGRCAGHLGNALAASA